jgi:16S rRNA (uracil1498-N3)-methyltransferase
MKRFFSSKLSKSSTGLTLCGDEFHHLKNVLRLKPGDKVEIINGKGLLATALIDFVNRHSAGVIIEDAALEISKESPVKITLIQGLLKGGNEETVTSATVLGAKEIRFFTSDYTATKPVKSKEEQQKKWRKAGVEAAKQCGRTIVPDIKGPLTLNEAIDGMGAAFKIALFESEGEAGLKEYFKNFKLGQSIAVIIGPEGGLSPGDLETIRSAGFHTVRMGPRRLRSEAATHTALSIIEYELGNLGAL